MIFFCLQVDNEQGGQILFRDKHIFLKGLQKVFKN